MSKVDLVEHMDDLLDFIADLPEQPVTIYQVDNYGTDGMSELFDRNGWN
jgi:hypothetical protein